MNFTQIAFHNARAGKLWSATAVVLVVSSVVMKESPAQTVSSTTANALSSQPSTTKQSAAESTRPPAVLKYNDGTADGKKSLGGSGEMIRFEMPAGVDAVRGLRIHGSRYGLPEAPKEDFEMIFMNEAFDEVLHTEKAPYELFRRGREVWVRVNFKEAVKVPDKFWVVLDFHAAQTKGVYVSYDTSSKGQYSRIGLPSDEKPPRETDFAGDWMVELFLERPATDGGTKAAPMRPAPPTSASK